MTLEYFPGEKLNIYIIVLLLLMTQATFLIRLMYIVNTIYKEKCRKILSLDNCLRVVCIQCLIYTQNTFITYKFKTFNFASMDFGEHTYIYIFKDFFLLQEIFENYDFERYAYMSIEE